jgi:hypothetical protein
MPVGASGFRLTPAATSIAAGGPLAVAWTAPSGRPASDYIGLYLVGTTSDQPVWWRRTSELTPGSFQLDAPSAPGNYEFRYISAGSAAYGYLDVAQSAAIAVR